MQKYGQFCPVAQALDIVGERWTLLVIRELLCGDYRFNELMNGLPLISRSVLAQRLRSLEEAGLIERRPAKERTGTVYCITDAGRELEPVVIGLGNWAMRWGTRKLDKADLDPVLLMWDMRRGLEIERLPERQTVVMFWYRDVPAKRSRYWLRIDRPDIDLCLTNPGFDVELKVESTIRTMVDVWLGHRDLREALTSRAIQLAGQPSLVSAFPTWLKLNPFAKVDRLTAAE